MPKRLHALLFLTLCAALTACGGGGSGGTSAPSNLERQTSSRHVLLIGLDGLDIEPLQQAVHSGQAPALAQLAIRPAFSGGISGTVTAQQTLSGPGWASLVTGTWANRHQVVSDGAAADLQAPTLFQQLQTANPQQQAAVIVSNPLLPTLLQKDRQSGAIKQFTDCAGVDLCVSDAAGKAISSGQYALVVANFNTLAAVAQNGSGAAYQQALSQLDQRVGQLLSAIRTRQSANPQESWLIVASSDRGLRTSASNAALDAATQTSFIALNQSGNSVFQQAKASDSDIYRYPSQADITPTILDFMQAQGRDSTQWKMDGQSLLSTPGVQMLRSQANIPTKTISLNWRLPADDTLIETISLYRDSVLLQSLPANTTTFTDNPPLGQDGERTYTFNYVVIAANTAAATQAQIDYVVPDDQLRPSLLEGLLNLLPFNNNLSDVVGGAAFSRLKSSDSTAPSFAADNFGGQSLVINPKINSYTLASNTATPAQFSIGLWFNSDATQAWLPIVANKDWDGGGSTPGLIISQTSSKNGVTFNIGDGSQRVDSTFSLPSNQWVYLALTINKTTRQAVAYLGVPGQKLQSATMDLTSMNMVNAFPAGPLVFNEDGTGNFYGKGYAMGQVAPKYNDVAVWNRRTLGSRDITMLFTAGKSLTTLLTP
ncbi:alkaline phosphatase family protein [Neisseriaceae bacterium TC5R-5]|nr:alkaline phosphatase family protein [Neisseriaceae bacterium TC5R-5]